LKAAQAELERLVQVIGDAKNYGKRRLLAEMNVVPYIDVMLVLLIIFMITTPLLSRGVEVELPKANAQPLKPREMQEPIHPQCGCARPIFPEPGQ